MNSLGSAAVSPSIQDGMLVKTSDGSSGASPQNIHNFKWISPHIKVINVMNNLWNKRKKYEWMNLKNIFIQQGHFDTTQLIY